MKSIIKRERERTNGWISLYNHTKHRGHPFVVATCDDHVQVVQGILREEAFHEKTKQVRVSSLHHIQTLLQHLLLLLSAQFRGFHQRQQLSFLLFKVLFAMILPMETSNKFKRRMWRLVTNLSHTHDSAHEEVLNGIEINTHEHDTIQITNRTFRTEIAYYS